MQVPEWQRHRQVGGKQPWAKGQEPPDVTTGRCVETRGGTVAGTRDGGEGAAVAVGADVWAGKVGVVAGSDGGGAGVAVVRTLPDAPTGVAAVVEAAG
jgi:hypothetical protein